MTRYPEITAALFDRLTERSLRLATTQAISQLTRVDRRLKALFWHLAERWGRVSGDGVIVPLALTHRILGQLVGARRPDGLDRAERARRARRAHPPARRLVAAAGRSARRRVARPQARGGQPSCARPGPDAPGAPLRARAQAPDAGGRRPRSTACATRWSRASCASCSTAAAASRTTRGLSVRIAPARSLQGSASPQSRRLPPSRRLRTAAVVDVEPILDVRSRAAGGASTPGSGRVCTQRRRRRGRFPLEPALRVARGEHAHERPVRLGDRRPPADRARLRHHAYTAAANASARARVLRGRHRARVGPPPRRAAGRRAAGDARRDRRRGHRAVARPAASSTPTRRPGGSTALDDAARRASRPRPTCATSTSSTTRAGAFDLRPVARAGWRWRAWSPSRSR